MAEIKIEKKKPVWPWIVAVLLISAIIYYIFLRDNETQTQNNVEIENTTSTDNTTN
ncbi:hypothetical protein [Flavobacterium aquidurense]|uniref:Uncharacterized protein n=1 Tax=Flavobacterium aquidurense TaxID=362413 RepID=A0A0Q1BNW4_9FLAO|nr:hypothetical protein [Flavobacterium aquidurense]KQB42582.1 hypothetical protein RC62_3589 [Flavobacterium aquidurense]